MSFIDYLKEQINHKVITFDFDHTLKFEHGEPNQPIIDKFKELQKNNDVYIITTRYSNKKNEVIEFVKDHNLKPKDIICTDGKDKIEFLKRLNSELHFDDDDKEIKDAKNVGINTINAFNQEEWNKYVNEE